MRSNLVGLFCLVTMVAASATFAQSPSTLSFQGRLTDAGGTPINNASQSITFALYKGSTKIWQETQSVNVANGIYNVLLGSVVPVDTIRFDRPIDLGVKVGADAEMTPRTQLAAAAVARSLPGLYTFYHDDQFNDGHNLIMGFGQADPGVAGAVVLGGGIHGVRNIVTNDYATIAGGQSNRASTAATVGGGSSNIATGSWSTIGGGELNSATAYSATVAGGVLNRASGESSMVPGGRSNYASGLTSFAGGYKARAKHDGSFVWNDRSVIGGNDSLLSTTSNQFVVRATNGIGINRAPANRGIHLKQQTNSATGGIRTEYGTDTDYWDTWIDGFNDYNFGYNGTLMAYIDDVNGAFVALSDAALKKEVEHLGTVLQGVLQLRPATYRFNHAPEASHRSLGLIAQEVEPLFPELISDKDGVKGMNYAGLGVIAIKAIQELYALVQDQQARLERQEAELAQLRAAAAR